MRIRVGLLLLAGLEGGNEKVGEDESQVPDGHVIGFCHGCRLFRWKRVQLFEAELPG
jgi:hypothetical protein